MSYYKVPEELIAIENFYSFIDKKYSLEQLNDLLKLKNKCKPVTFNFLLRICPSYLSKIDYNIISLCRYITGIYNCNDFNNYLLNVHLNSYSDFIFIKELFHYHCLYPSLFVTRDENSLFVNSVFLFIQLYNKSLEFNNTYSNIFLSRIYPCKNRMFLFSRDTIIRNITETLYHEYVYDEYYSFSMICSIIKRLSNIDDVYILDVMDCLNNILKRLTLRLFSIDYSFQEPFIIDKMEEIILGLEILYERKFNTTIFYDCFIDYPLKLVIIITEKLIRRNRINLPFIFNLIKRGEIHTDSNDILTGIINICCILYRKNRMTKSEIEHFFLLVNNKALLFELVYDNSFLDKVYLSDNLEKYIFVDTDSSFLLYDSIDPFNENKVLDFCFFNDLNGTLEDLVKLDDSKRYNKLVIYINSYTFKLFDYYRQIYNEIYLQEIIDNGRIYDLIVMILLLEYRFNKPCSIYIIRKIMNCLESFHYIKCMTKIMNFLIEVNIPDEKIFNSSTFPLKQMVEFIYSKICNSEDLYLFLEYVKKDYNPFLNLKLKSILTCINKRLTFLYNECIIHFNYCPICIEDRLQCIYLSCGHPICIYCFMKIKNGCYYHCKCNELI